MLRRFIIGLGLLASLAGPALTDPALADGQTLRASPHAFPAVTAPTQVAQNGSCAGTCQANHDRCRVQTKGSPSCDAERQRCLQQCIASKQR